MHTNLKRNNQKQIKFPIYKYELILSSKNMRKGRRKFIGRKQEDISDPFKDLIINRVAFS